MEEAVGGEEGRVQLPTCDIDLHLAGAGADGVGGLADVGPCQAVVDRSPEEEGPVLSLHALGERAVQPAGSGDKAGVTLLCRLQAWQAPF